MPNPHYIKGRRKEYAVIKEAKSEGKIAFRSAGSHSPIDVVTIDPRFHNIEFIQCKPDNISELDKMRLEWQFHQLNDKFNVKFKVV